MPARAQQISAVRRSRGSRWWPPLRAAPRARVKVKFTVNFIVCYKRKPLTYGGFDCEFDFHSHEWSRSQRSETGSRSQTIQEIVQFDFTQLRSIQLHTTSFDSTSHNFVRFDFTQLRSIRLHTTWLTQGRECDRNGTSLMFHRMVVRVIVKLTVKFAVCCWAKTLAYDEFDCKHRGKRGNRPRTARPLSKLPKKPPLDRNYHIPEAVIVVIDLLHVLRAV